MHVCACVCSKSGAEQYHCGQTVALFSKRSPSSAGRLAYVHVLEGSLRVRCMEAAKEERDKAHPSGSTQLSLDGERRRCGL